MILNYFDIQKHILPYLGYPEFPIVPTYISYLRLENKLKYEWHWDVNATPTHWFSLVTVAIMDMVICPSGVTFRSWQEEGHSDHLCPMSLEEWLCVVETNRARWGSPEAPKWSFAWVSVAEVFK